jgi:uncharacterized protein YcgI (DUF1989 family)
MTTVQTKQEISETNRRRYEELRAAGQDVTPMGLPEATALDGAPIAPETVISREQVPAGWYATVRLRRGEALRIVEDTGHSSVSLIGWREEDTSERINCADTVKVQWSAAISKGRVILSDMGRVLLSLVEDTSGAHDLLVGGSTPASTLAAYGATSRNTHENFLSAAAKIGLGLRDIPPCVTFFAETVGGFRRAACRDEPRAGAVELRSSAGSGATRCLRTDHVGQAPRAATCPRRSPQDNVSGNHPRLRVYGSALRLRRDFNDQSRSPAIDSNYPRRCILP